MNVRALAARLLSETLYENRSFKERFSWTQKKIPERDRGLFQELCFGVLRNLPLLESQLEQLMQRKLLNKQAIVQALLLIGMYQIHFLRIPDHAALYETVEATKVLGQGKFTPLVNGILRNAQRKLKELPVLYQVSDPESHLHPDWLVQKLRQAYPKAWLTIINGNNQKAPLCLRVNRQKISRSDYLDALKERGIEGQILVDCPDAILLKDSIPFERLPGAGSDWVSIQDSASQRAVLALNPCNEDKVLDLCGAPGGKAKYITEIAQGVDLTIVDLDSKRHEFLKKVFSEKGNVRLIVGNACHPENWVSSNRYDKILLDAPCSATGIIRRYPDIKWRRKPEHIRLLVPLQAAMLRAIWPYLKEGGCLLYATCSVLPEENREQIERFLSENANAALDRSIIKEGMGRQILPGEDEADGFFYSRILKRKA